MRCIRRRGRVSVTAQLEGRYGQRRSCVAFRSCAEERCGHVGSTELALASWERSLSVSACCGGAVNSASRGRAVQCRIHHMGRAQERQGVSLLNGWCVKQVLACCGSAFVHQGPNPPLERTRTSKAPWPRCAGCLSCASRPRRLAGAGRSAYTLGPSRTMSAACSPSLVILRRRCGASGEAVAYR
jgi:hypothetical protein